MRIFVYGLLRTGESMGPLMRSAVRVGPATVDGFDLYDLGPYPAAVEGDGTLVGELFELDDHLLGLLDEAEGCHYAPPLYRRVEVQAGGASAWLYAYARDLDGALKIASGDWLKR